MRLAWDQSRLVKDSQKLATLRRIGNDLQESGYRLVSEYR